MAQARVTEFFSTRKNRRTEQPSKRRKVDFTETTSEISQVRTGPIKLTNTNLQPDVSAAQQNGEISTPNKEQVLESVLQTTRSTRSSSRSTRSATRNTSQKSETSTKRSTRSRRTQKNTIPDLFETLAQKINAGNDNTLVVKEKNPDDASVNRESAVVTDNWDEHDGFSSNAEENSCYTPPRSSAKKGNGRKRKKDQKLLEIQAQQLQATPTQVAKEVTDKTKPISVKKKLVMTSKQKTGAENTTINNPAEQDHSKEAVLELAASMSPPKAISPLPGTPQKTRSLRQKKKVIKPSEKILAVIEQCKSLKSDSPKETPLIDPAVVKARLAKCGKLEELKAQLSKMNSAKAKAKPKKPKAKEPVEAESPKLKPFDSLDVAVEETQCSEIKKVPAYERHHHLAIAEAPTLSLPYKYRVLAEMFRGMDTVVSMLHNRSEIITFSKLKVAVQTMNKRNFEMRHAGQIKTVFPSGYIYRQEKGLPCYGGKVSAYQLTVEPNLQFNTNTGEDEPVKASILSNTRMTFSPTHLLHRRGYFHNRLISIVKRYHREFLSKLSKPLSIPDDKITRWHPQFKLDEVPDVEVGSLPEPPYEKKYHTAKDVLEATRGKLLPQVEKALESVAAKSEGSSDTKPADVKNSKPPKTTAIKGVPQSLLEKIRAKEAAKLQASLTRNPAEERKTLMMSRLPDMMRIVRNYYVTEKKHTLQMENVVQKLQDSYRSTIALSDVESHVKLMVELTPEWLSLQVVRKGRYLKLSLAMELQTVQDKVRHLVKSRK